MGFFLQTSAALLFLLFLVLGFTIAYLHYIGAPGINVRGAGVRGQG
jgi:hypothetical protein